MLGKRALPVVALAAVAIVGTSAAATGQRGQLSGVDASTRASIVQYLGSLGVHAAGKHIVVQRGTHNYVGATCPGITWTCTAPAKGKLVVQFAQRAAANQFVCTPSSGGSQSPPNSCSVVQVSSGGSNSAQCIEPTNATSGVVQTCDIQQTNTTGSNYAQVVQQVNALGGWSQDAMQTAQVSQVSQSGQNTASVQQTISQQTQNSGSGGAQSQEGHQTVAIGQQSDTGNNNATAQQSQVQNEQIVALAGRNPPVQAIDQTQNADDAGPNANGGIYQSSTSGNLNAQLQQSIQQSANAPSRNVTGSQTQGSPTGGVNGHFDQSTSGLANAAGLQHEQQDFGSSSPSLTQMQFDPAWLGSPQQTNPNDHYSINQQTQQNASGNADQTDQIFSNCDTTGICSANEDTTQNGTHQHNSCTGSVCHIATDCSDGSCTTSNCGVEPCETPPAPPPNPLGPPPPTVSSVTFTGGSDSPGPTVTVTGSGFGSDPPPGLDNSTTSCGSFEENGDLYVEAFYFMDTTNAWGAGEGTPPGGDCIGIVVQSWSDTQVVFTFGSVYADDDFGDYMADQGDGFTLYVEGTPFSGTVSYPVIP